jgi:hypothetical protein
MKANRPRRFSAVRWSSQALPRRYDGRDWTTLVRRILSDRNPYRLEAAQSHPKMPVNANRGQWNRSCSVVLPDVERRGGPQRTQGQDS